MSSDPRSLEWVYQDHPIGRHRVDFWSDGYMAIATENDRIHFSPDDARALRDFITEALDSID